MSAQVEYRGFSADTISRVQTLEEDQIKRRFPGLTSEDKIVIQPKTLNGLQKLINWLFGVVFSKLTITVEKQPRRLVSRATVTIRQQEKPLENPRILTRITARNVSYEPVERINVYMSGKEGPILGTDFEGGYSPSDLSSQFFSSVAATKPYTIKAIVRKKGKCYSGELEVKKPGHLEIQIDKTATVMHLYKDREKTELLESKSLALVYGNHPLI